MHDFMNEGVLLRGHKIEFFLTLMHPEQTKLSGGLAILSAIGGKFV